MIRGMIVVWSSLVNFIFSTVGFETEILDMLCRLMAFEVKLRQRGFCLFLSVSGN